MRSRQPSSTSRPADRALAYRTQNNNEGARRLSFLIPHGRSKHSSRYTLVSILPQITLRIIVVTVPSTADVLLEVVERSVKEDRKRLALRTVGAGKRRRVECLRVDGVE